MLKFYYNAAPNPMKVALLLEELGLPYEAVPVDTRKGEQFAAQYLKVNPNGKVPAIVDGDVRVFDSNAILLYLADREKRFVPLDPGSKARGDMLSWLMFIASGIGPFSGQSAHFRNMAPEPKEYALNRYDFEAHRHWKLLEDRLANSRYMLGEEYSIVDMAFWGWHKNKVARKKRQLSKAAKVAGVTSPAKKTIKKTAVKTTKKPVKKTTAKKTTKK